MKLYIGSNIREQREKANLTQAELAKKIGVSDKLVWSWEKNRTEPKAPHVQKMLEIFGCSEEELCKQINIDICYDEYLLIESYRNGTPSDRAYINRMLKYLNAMKGTNK